MVDAVSSNGATLKVVPTDKDEENNPSIKTAVKSYNDAITVLGTAITAYNKAYDDLYKRHMINRLQMQKMLSILKD